MAASPPLNVMEDQTNEDFFDKLVDDDFGPAHLVSKFGEGGSDSDEAKAFANLSIEDTIGNVSGGVGPESSVENETVGLPNVPVKEGVDDGFGSQIDPSVSDVVQGTVLDLAVSKTSGSEKSGVKEVGWSSFHADMVPNGNHGFGSYSDLFGDGGDNDEDFFGEVDGHANLANNSEDFSGKVDTHAILADAATGSGLEESVSHEYKRNGTQVYGGSEVEVGSGQDVNSRGYWENMYPGWKYDPSTEQWYQVDDFDLAVDASVNHRVDQKGNEWEAVSEGNMEASYFQQGSQSLVGGTLAETSTTENVATWNQDPPVSNNEYPEHMYFDLQYPGWYYDMRTQEWRSLESYTSSVQSTAVLSQEPQNQNGMAFGSQCSQVGSIASSDYGESNKFRSQIYGSQGQQHSSWGYSYSNSYNQPGSSMWQPETIAMTDVGKSFGGNQQFTDSYVSNPPVNNHAHHQATTNSLATVSSFDNLSQRQVQENGFVGSQAFFSGGDFARQLNQANLDQNAQMSFSNNYYGSQNPANSARESVQTIHQFSYASNAGRSSAGRPPHALVTFGFGGKLVVMKDSTSTPSFAAQAPVGGTVSVLNLMEVVLASTANTPAIGSGSSSYFHALCQQSFPGPLVGGSVGNKELNKWIDERITSCESPDMDYRKGEVLKLLLSLLRIGCQHYGKLRSPFGTDSSLQDNDSPESAVAKLFASVQGNESQMNAYGAIGHCLQNLPSDGQIWATASEVQHLLVSGRKIEALQCAQEGQLWGPALVLASQLGNQFYAKTVKQMALQQLVAGSPLRTLCLLIAGQPREVFSTGSLDSSIPSGFNASHQPMQSEANVVDEWEENLAVMAANRTKDDELVIVHIGDCLWKDRSEIIGAHICYLVAEANVEPYSDSARLCLITADHWRHPRTYASPEAIQRTELYEYSKVLGNSQFILQPFQPYKLLYIYMLAEVGKVSDSLKYCQAVLKSLKTGRAPEVETWRQLVISLEERLRTHQQGGYTTNLAPAKLVGKLLNFFDSTAHRVVGGLPPPAPLTSHGSAQHSEHVYPKPMVPRVSTSQSTMAMSSLMPFASMASSSEWTADGSKRAMHNRSVSEPDFGRSPRHVDSSKEESLSNSQGRASSSPGSSRFGRFGFGSQLLQKTVGLLMPRSDKQAKLGEKNKFYYDEKLKRWVEEGVEPSTEEAALPPPPTTSAFQNGMNDYNLNYALKIGDGAPANGSPIKSPSSMEHTSGIPPPIPASSNQFSARGRLGVRARYVDTFNQGGGASANLFHSSAAPSLKPAMAANAKFFIPAPTPTTDHSVKSVAENAEEVVATTENSVASTANDPFHSPETSSSVTMQRFPSMDNITRKGAMNGGNGLHSSHSRRTASWSGSFSDSIPSPSTAEFKLPGRTLDMPPFSTPSYSSPTPMQGTGSSFGDELQEVEL